MNTNKDRGGHTPPIVERSIVERLRLIQGTQFTPIENALVDEAADTITALVEALEGLADVIEHDCDCPPCIGSMAPGEHYLGLARAAIAKATGQSPPSPRSQP
jgi:hypothetical protein